MVQAWLGRVMVMALTFAIFAAGAPISAARTGDDAIALSNQEIQLSNQGKYREALPLAEKAVTLAERAFGKEQMNTLRIVNNLALLYQNLGRYQEAEALYRRALEAQERVLGKENPDTLLSMNNLALLYQTRGRYQEAEPLYRRALEAQERVIGNEHRNTLTSMNNLGLLYLLQGRYREAEPLHRRALQVRERKFGKDDSDTLQSVCNLSGLYYVQGRYQEAEPLYRRTLETHERVLGKEHPNTLQSVHNLADLYQAQGRYQEAETLFRRALEARERVLGKEHPDTLRSVHNLATLYKDQGRYQEAEPLLRRALEARERVLGKEHPDTLASVNNLAALYQDQGRYQEAEPLYRRALAVQERVLGKEHPDTLTSVSNLAFLYYAQGRYQDAEPLNRRALEARERVIGDEHPDALASLNNLAFLYFEQRDWTRASDFWRRSTAAIASREQRGALAASQGLTGKKKSETERFSPQFRGLVRATYRLASESGAPDLKAAREMFETAQWAQGSEAAASLAQMATRGVKGDARLAALVRERQDLVAEWQMRDAQRNAAHGQAPEKRNAKAEGENNARLAAIDARIAGIDKELAAAFPDYAALSSPTPLTVEEAQSLLGADEALILFLDTPKWKTASEETFIWVVTRTDVRWVRSDMGAATLAREVQALRCGLAEAAWQEKSCTDLTSQRYTDEDRASDKPLPFDHARANKLYQALFGQIEDLIKGKHLLLVPSGALTQLPFQVLVTTPPAGEDAPAAWLIRDHALTVLPAVSSLKALRRVVRPSAATKPLIGFGDPLLEGPSAAYASLAKLARDNQSCSSLSTMQLAAASPRGVAQLQTRGGFADVSFVRSQAPLPETADELCAVARDVHADQSDIHLGAHATESEVKRLSDSGDLAKYRIVHFATHGALAGQISGNSEPGLLLTPPASPSAQDDGYLTASEIAGLKLDADWVILSACNTAAGGAEGADALSGLARAFIYAQARALLVSHWAVNSDATVKLITGAFARLSADPVNGPRGGDAPVHARAHRQGRPGGAAGLLGAVRGRRRGRSWEVV